MTDFADMNLEPQVAAALADNGYETPTPIQARAIPALLEGKDLLGIAQTGTGKTAAFALPCLDRLARTPGKLTPGGTRVLVLAPTRELATQIAESFRALGKKIRPTVITVFGGVKINPQIAACKRGCDVLVATPGRLVDLIGRGALDLGKTEVFILDEADQMLDMGFIRDIRKIAERTPKDRQTLLFSATMPDAIGELAKGYLTDPVKVSVAPQSTTAERVDQGALYVAKANKVQVLAQLLRRDEVERAIVFTKTKHGADKVVKSLATKDIAANAIHGNKSQNQRTRALDAFRSGAERVLVATDIAARGIDVDGITHVINYEMPTQAEQYVHRIGRTARAGRDGAAVSLIAEDETYYLLEVERTTGVRLTTLEPPTGCEELCHGEPDRSKKVPKPKGPSGNQGRGQRGGQGGGQPKAGAGRGGQGQPRGQRSGAEGAGKPAGRRPRRRSSASRG